ncbi:hypothetical protein U4E84_13385 [Halorubrum sp. AD140]|uniref:hypothetical protein n=1 Tax=Halorubrum sp. AD140 TaxID=3050073 RepID=UPI002ACCD874|nr:hypothetical protein [Halorubrum sp. AD140]MDZ5812336.1 hypothetical protein [Halorubrum sp. AD140]
MAHDPLSPAQALRTRIGTAVGGIALLFLLYSVLIVGRLLFGVLVAFGLTVGLYLAYRTFAALDALADAAQRIAATREREVERESRVGSAAERDDRLTERER